MNILFWNTGNKNVNQVIINLINDIHPNIVCLAEYNNNTNQLLQSIHKNGLTNFHIVPKIACHRLVILSNYSFSSFKHKRDDDRYTIKELNTPGFPPLIIAFIHLPSKLYYGDDDQLLRATQVRRDIEEVEESAGHNNTLIIGDFNMNPFDKGMISVNGFNSLPCSKTANRLRRNFGNESFQFFYNPSWNLLGDYSKPAGTYFHKSPGSLSHYWNTLDQVIIRPSIASIFDNSSLKTIFQAGTQSLINKNNTPQLSDHLPISFSITPNNPKKS